MRPVRVCLAAVLMLTGGAAVSCASDAYAQGEVTVTPYRVQRGDPVVVSTGACRGGQASADSVVFEAPVHLRREHYGGLTGRGKIRWTARAGAYPVWVDCDGGKRVARGRVVVEEQHPRPAHWRNNWHHQPWSPVTAGGGGTAKETAETRRAQEEDSPLPDPLPLALAGGGAAVLALTLVRRRRRGIAPGTHDGPPDGR